MNKSNIITYAIITLLIIYFFELRKKKIGENLFLSRKRFREKNEEPDLSHLEEHEDTTPHCYESISSDIVLEEEILYMLYHLLDRETSNIVRVGGAYVLWEISGDPDRERIRAKPVNVDNGWMIDLWRERFDERYKICKVPSLNYEWY